MANHKSALKRARQNTIRRMRNKAVRTRVKTIVKDVREAAQTSPESAAQKLDQAKSIIAKAARKGTLHKRTAARKISRLAKLVNSVTA